MNCFCILLASFLNLSTLANENHVLPQDFIQGFQVSLSCAHCRDSYRPFALVIRPSNSSAAPGAAVVSVMAGMGSDWAQRRQRRLTGMLLGWKKGLIVIHELVRAAAPGLGAAAGYDGQSDTEWVQNERDGPVGLYWHTWWGADGRLVVIWMLTYISSAVSVQYWVLDVMQVMCQLQRS